MQLAQFTIFLFLVPANLTSYVYFYAVLFSATSLMRKIYGIQDLQSIDPHCQIQLLYFVGIYRHFIAAMFLLLTRLSKAKVESQPKTIS